MKDWPFPCTHNKPISQGSALCVSASSQRYLTLFDGVLNKRHSLYCAKKKMCGYTVIVPSQIPIVFCLGILDIDLTDLKQPNGANHFLLIAS